MDGPPRHRRQQHRLRKAHAKPHLRATDVDQQGRLLPGHPLVAAKEALPKADVRLDLVEVGGRRSALGPPASRQRTESDPSPLPTPASLTRSHASPWVLSETRSCSCAPNPLASLESVSSRGTSRKASARTPSPSPSLHAQHGRASQSPTRVAKSFDNPTLQRSPSPARADDPHHTCFE